MTTAKFCPNCGEPIEPGARFCIGCGTPVADMNWESTEDVTDAPPEGDETQAMPPVHDEEPQEEPPTEATEADDANEPEDERAASSEATIVFPPQEGAPGVTQRIPVAASAPRSVPQGTFTTTATASPVTPRPTIGSSADPRTSTGGQEPRHSSTIAFAIIIAAALFIIGFLVYLLVAAPQQRATQQAQSTQQQTSDPSGSGTSSQTTKDTTQQDTTDTSEEEKNAARDQKLHDALVGYYNKLPDYDTRIKNVANTFNGDYLSTNMSTRRNDAKICNDLRDEIQDKVNEINNLDRPDGSAYKDQYDLILRCYRDHLERVNCIADAWEIDLGYANPSDHKDEILQPIETGYMPGTDKSSALDDYQRAYPQISL